MPNSSRRDTVELKRPRARLNLLLLIPAVAALSAAGIFANPGTIVSTPPVANRSALAVKIDSRELSFDATTDVDASTNAARRAIELREQKKTRRSDVD